MGRLANSWALTKASLRIVAQDKELLVLPVLSFLASVVALLCVLGIGFGARLTPAMTVNGQANIPVILLTALLYLSLAFIQVFFGAAVVAGAMERMSGGDPTLASCLRAASRKAGRLLAWSVMVAVVNIVLEQLRQRGGTLGRIGAGVGSLAWSLTTYFMLPVLMFEDKPLTASVGRSGSLFKQTWGETVIGNGGVGFVFGLAMVALIMLGLFFGQPLYAAGGLLAALPLLVLVGFGVLLLATLSSVVGSVYRAALYRFATTGQGVTGFEPQHLQGAFQPR